MRERMQFWGPKALSSRNDYFRGTRRRTPIFIYCLYGKSCTSFSDLKYAMRHSVSIRDEVGEEVEAVAEEEGLSIREFLRSGSRILYETSPSPPGH